MNSRSKGQNVSRETLRFKRGRRDTLPITISGPVMTEVNSIIGDAPAFLRRTGT